MQMEKEKLTSFINSLAGKVGLQRKETRRGKSSGVGDCMCRWYLQKFNKLLGRGKHLKLLKGGLDGVQHGI